MPRTPIQHPARFRRSRRVRRSVRGTRAQPRLSVFRSGRHISAQLIDDGAGVTLASAMDQETTAPPRPSTSTKGSVMVRRERAFSVGVRLAERALAMGIRRARFDRGPYRYHGLVAAVAEGSRQGGLEF